MVEGSSPTCSALTREGKPCSARPRPGSDRCPWHDADLSAQRRAWSARGGSRRSNTARARKRLPDGALTVDELRGVLGTALNDVLAGKLEPGPANAAAALARALLAATEASAVESLERDVAELRSLIAARGLA